MSDSIRLTDEATREIDEICAGYDPAKNPELQRYLDRIPDPDARAAELKFHQDYQRARVEVFYLVSAVREYAIAASDYHRIILVEMTDCHLGDAALEDHGHFKEADSEHFNRHFETAQLFDNDGDLGDGYGNATFDERWAAITSAAGQSLVDPDGSATDGLLCRIIEFEESGRQSL